MNKEGDDFIEMQLSDWRERGEDRLAPSRFYFIEALSRRANQKSGTARRLLEERLSRHLQAYQAEIVAPMRLSGRSEREEQKQLADKTAAGPLAEFLAYAASQAPGGSLDRPASGERAQHSALNLDPALIDYFRNTWASVSANGLLRQSQAQVPDNAGPLNSSSLAHRALMLMREQSPGYLQHFLSYMDALSWMEQLNDERARTTGKPALAGKSKASKRQAS